eukprot:m.260737 g.260737  ORF g.260737 m.260737 type:complete len:300 (+) comp40529_c0_seq1:93-992(+)
MSSTSTMSAFGLLVATVLASSPSGVDSRNGNTLPKPVVFWNFSATNPLVDKVSGYVLEQLNASEPVGIVATNDSTWPNAAAFGFGGHGQQLKANRSTVPRLASISGPKQSVTVIAWIKPNLLSGGAMVCGVWDESNSWRQYAIFMDHTGGCIAPNGLVAHISAEGGPSPNQQYCESRACGITTLSSDTWHCVSNTYDAQQISAYVNGTLDSNRTSPTPDPNNPFLYPNPPKFPNGGIFTPPKGQGAAFTVGSNVVHVGGGSGPGHIANKYKGLIGGLVVYDTALSQSDVATVCGSSPIN